MLARTDTNVICPLEIIKVNGIKCRALLDTGSGSSHASESLIDLFKMNPARKEHKIMKTLTNSTIKKCNYIM